MCNKHTDRRALNIGISQSFNKRMFAAIWPIYCSPPPAVIKCLSQKRLFDGAVTSFVLIHTSNVKQWTRLISTCSSCTLGARKQVFTRAWRAVPVSQSRVHIPVSGRGY